MIELPPKLEKQDLSLENLLLLNRAENTVLINEINQKYLYWDKVKYKIPTGVKPALFWLYVKLSRKTNAKTIQFGKYKFSFMMTERMMSLLHVFDMNMGGNIGAQGIIPEKDKKVYLINSIMEEAIASSQMEGASTTRKVAKEMLRQQKKPINKSQQMIMNNYQTISYLSGHKDAEFNLENILEIHKRISADTLDNHEDEGRFRQTNDIVVQNAITGEIVHTPPTHDEIETLLRDLCKFANSDDPNDFIHPIVKGIIIHFVLSYIHPFVDGNGRTARSMFYWYLLQKGYWLLEYLSISKIIYKGKAQYERAFLYVEADENDMSYFIHYHLEAMNQAYQELKKYLAKKISEHHNVHKFVGIQNINERQAQIIQMFYDKPDSAVYAKEIAIRFGISEITARADLRHLQEVGLLVELSTNKKSHIFKPVDDFYSRIEKMNENKLK